MAQKIAQIVWTCSVKNIHIENKRIRNWIGRGHPKLIIIISEEKNTQLE